MLFFLFSPEELEEVFDRLGYEYSSETLRKNVEYYEHRTTPRLHPELCGSRPRPRRP